MFKLRLQFFLVMLVICSLLTVGIHLFIKINFKRDFWQYIEKKETRFARPLIADLTANYHNNQNWEWITNWDEYVAAHVDFEVRQRSNPNAQRHRESNEQGEPPHGPMEVPPPNREPNARQEGINPEEKPPEEKAAKELKEFRRLPSAGALRAIFLLNSDHKIIAGRNQKIKDAFLIPIEDDGVAIGYLGIPFNPAIRDLQDADFANEQEQKIAFIILLALLVASTMSFPLAHLLTKRIKKLVEQVTQFSQGNYQEKISVKGQDEISVLAEHLNDLGETLAQSESSRRQWVADISHELRTPIAVLQAELESMEDGVRALDSQGIKRLMKHSQRLKHLVNDLYELSVTDLGGMTYRKNTLDLNALLQDAVTSMQPQFANTGIAITLQTPTNPVPFLGDHNRLQQLFANLLKNSLQYTNSPGDTQVALLQDAESITIIIEDSSPGVDEEHHDKLFDRLYRADSSRNRETGGAGLGLSICKNIVAAHDGKISTSNSALGGLTITINFPSHKV